MSPPTAQREPTRLRRTYVYRLKPTAAQERALQAYPDVTRELYNAALEQRIWARRIGARQPNQSAQLPELRASHLDGFNAQVLQQVLRRLDRAYDGFFRRCASGAARKGFPRFRSARRWRSFTFPQFPSGCALADGRLRIQNVGAVRIHQHRLLAGIPKTCAIVRARRDFHFKLALDLVRRFDRIAVENLAVAAMLVDGRSRSRGLNRSVGRCRVGAVPLNPRG